MLKFQNLIWHIFQNYYKVHTCKYFVLKRRTNMRSNGLEKEEIVSLLRDFSVCNDMDKRGEIYLRLKRALPRSNSENPFEFVSEVAMGTVFDKYMLILCKENPLLLLEKTSVVFFLMICGNHGEKNDELKSIDWNYVASL